MSLLRSARPQVSIFLACSLDGFIATPDGGVSWLLPYQGLGDDLGYGDFIATVDALLMGRNTWETVRGFSPWPYAGLRVLVRSHRPLDGAQNGEEVEVVAGPIADVLARLGAEGVRHVYVDGGVTARDALAEGVVDRVTLTTIPVVLGGGIPLFGGAAGVGTWQLRSTRAGPQGVLQATYAPPLALAY